MYPQEESMLDSLIESRHPTAYRSAFGGGAVSLLVHSMLIAGAVYATLHASETRGKERIIAKIILPAMPKEPRRPVSPNPGTLFTPLAPIRLVVSPQVPVEIPPPSTAPFDPARFTGIGPDSGIVLGRAPLFGQPVAPAAIYAANLVEERPERIGGPEPRYPEMLRQAGIEGQVVVECVIDTSGRAEPGSIRVVSSTHALFERPAREAIEASVFRPARLDGHAVRVRVQLPLNFRMARGGPAGP
jgi:protein TonB